MDRVVQGVIGHHVVERADVLHLAARLFHPPPQALVGLGHAPLEPAFQLVNRGRDDEDHHRLRREALDRRRALHVDLGEDVVARRHRVADLRFRHAVRVAVDLGVFEEVALVQHAPEGGLGDELVVHAVALVGPYRPGGGGDGEVERQLQDAHAVEDGVFADAGGPGEHDEERRAARLREQGRLLRPQSRIGS